MESAKIKTKIFGIVEFVKKYRVLAMVSAVLLMALLVSLFALSRVSGGNAIRTVDKKLEINHDAALVSSTAVTTTQATSTLVTDTGKSTTAITAKPKNNTTTKPAKPAIDYCYKSIDIACGSIIQSWALRESPAKVNGWSVSGSAAGNGVNINVDAQDSAYITSDIGTYRLFTDTTDCVVIGFHQYADSTGSYVTTFPNDHQFVKICSTTADGSTATPVFRNSICHPSYVGDIRHGTWPEPTYGSANFSKSVNIPGSYFTAGSWSFYIFEDGYVCTGLLSQSKSVDLTP